MVAAAGASLPGIDRHHLGDFDWHTLVHQLQSQRFSEAGNAMLCHDMSRMQRCAVHRQDGNHIDDGAILLATRRSERCFHAVNQHAVPVFSWLPRMSLVLITLLF